MGDRVAYGLPPLGAYSQERVYPIDKLIKKPEGIDDVKLAAVLMKGLTAQYLLHRTYPVKPGDPILVHAAAGGMGLVLCQWAKHLGATVIGTVSTEAKAEVAKAPVPAGTTRDRDVHLAPAHAVNVAQCHVPPAVQPTAVRECLFKGGRRGPRRIAQPAGSLGRSLLCPREWRGRQM